MEVTHQDMLTPGTIYTLCNAIRLCLQTNRWLIKKPEINPEGYARYGNKTNTSKYELTTAMQHHPPTIKHN